MLTLEQLHQQALLQEQDFYIDPATGYQVCTALYHQKRGTCCECGCRHCPYGYNQAS